MNPNRSPLFWIGILLFSATFFPDCGSAKDGRQVVEGEQDVVIYGGTSAAVAAAVQVKRMGGTVVIIEPTGRIGGLTTGGLGQTDIGKKGAIGGISREFYQRVRQHYRDEKSWKWQKRSEYRSGGQSRTADTEDAMWTFEPSAALEIMNEMIREHDIPVVYHQRLDRSTQTAGVTREGKRIRSIRMESGREFRGQVFLDATYEGDLLAAAGIRYVVGREGNAAYGETLSGVQTARAIKHQFVRGVDPYVIKGDPDSGLLPGIDGTGPGVEGETDHRVQAYCYRMCLTDHPGNRIPFKKPQGYDEREYELLFRNFEQGAKVIPWSHSLMPNRKSDTNNNRGFSTDYVGQNYDYPEASYELRKKIAEMHRRYQQGLMWTLAYHPRTPSHVREVVSRWGTCKDEFERADGWQQQLYIREARRMVGQTVMTQHHCQGRMKAERPIGLAAYTMDSHNVQRHLGRDGFVKNEGDVQVGGFSPFPIDYGSILPRREECTNLIVPVCLSASHMAFGSIRMEPVFMVLGQSGGTAAMQAIREKKNVQDIDFEKLRAQLEKDKQVLVWTVPRRPVASGVSRSSLKGQVLDDTQAMKNGFGTFSTSAGPFVEQGYCHDSNDGKGRQSVAFELELPRAGVYQVRLAYTAHANRASRVPVTIHHRKGSSQILVDQKKKPSDAPFHSLGKFEFDTRAKIVISNEGTEGFVVADAVQLLNVSR